MTQLTAMIVNLSYSVIGGLLTLLFMYFGYKWFDRFTAFNTSNELSKDNRAVGMVVSRFYKVTAGAYRTPFWGAQR